MWFPELLFSLVSDGAILVISIGIGSQNLCILFLVEGGVQMSYTQCEGMRMVTLSLLPLQHTLDSNPNESES